MQFWKCLLRHWPMTPWPSNLISLWHSSMKCLAEVWLKSLHRFRSCHIHKTCGKCLLWPWPLNQWPSRCYHFHLYTPVVNCDQFHQNTSIHSGCIKANRHTDPILHTQTIQRHNFSTTYGGRKHSKKNEATLHGIALP